MSTVVFLTSGTSWTAPTGVTKAKVEVIANGGAGSLAGSCGGGGGAYSADPNVALIAGNAYTINFTGDVWFGGASLAASTVGAQSGTAGVSGTPGVGGLASAGVGVTKFSGGNGIGSASLGGGGGAAGPNGAGQVGQATTGGKGDNTSGGAGGASSSTVAGVAGGNGTEWDASHGSGGGGGGTTAAKSLGGAGGGYGAGGGGGVTGGGAAGAGLIVITYDLDDSYGRTTDETFDAGQLHHDPVFDPAFFDWSQAPAVPNLDGAGTIEDGLGTHDIGDPAFDPAAAEGWSWWDAEALTDLAIGITANGSEYVQTVDDPIYDPGAAEGTAWWDAGSFTDLALGVDDQSPAPLNEDDPAFLPVHADTTESMWWDASAEEDPVQGRWADGNDPTPNEDDPAFALVAADTSDGMWWDAAAEEDPVPSRQEDGTSPTWDTSDPTFDLTAYESFDLWQQDDIVPVEDMIGRDGLGDEVYPPLGEADPVFDPSYTEGWTDAPRAADFVQDDMGPGLWGTALGDEAGQIDDPVFDHAYAEGFACWDIASSEEDLVASRQCDGNADPDPALDIAFDPAFAEGWLQAPQADDVTNEIIPSRLYLGEDETYADIGYAAVFCDGFLQLASDTEFIPVTTGYIGKTSVVVDPRTGLTSVLVKGSTGQSSASVKGATGATSSRSVNTSGMSASTSIGWVGKTSSGTG